MKIAYINSFYYPQEVGGAEKSVRFLAEKMARDGHEVLVLTSGRKRETELVNGVVVERLPIKNIYFPLDAGKQNGLKKLIWHGLDSYNGAMARSVTEVLDKFRPSVAHTNTISGFSVAVWRALKDRNIPIVHTLRDYYLMCPNTAMFKAGMHCGSRCLKCVALSIPRESATNLPDVVIGNSRFILNKHIEAGLFRGVEAEVIYNAYERKISNQPLLKRDQLTLGYIGRLAPSKGIEVLLRVMAKLKDHSVKLLVAGEGDEAYLASLKGLATPQVEFLGHVKPDDFYNRIDWTVVPSVWDEPLARVIFESFCHGVPVIGSDMGGTPELVINEHTGYLVKAADDEALLSAIYLAMTGDSYTKFQRNCLEKVAIFAPDFVANRYISFYERAIKNGFQH